MLKIRKFMERFKQNMDDWEKLEDQMFERYDLVSWIQFLGKRSTELRRIFSDSEEMYAELSSYLNEKMDRKKADGLFAMLFELYNEAYDDPYLFELVGKRLLDYYEKRREYDKIVVLNCILGFEIMDYYKRYNDPVEDVNEPVEYFLNALALRDYYTGIKDSRIRRFFFVAYCNLISPLPNNCLMLRDRVFELYDQAVELWERADVQALDGENEDIRALIWKLDENFLAMEEYILECDEETRREFFLRAEKIICPKKKDKDSMRPGGFVQLAGNKGKILYGKMTKHQVVEEYIECLNRMPALDFEDPNELKTERSVIDIHSLADETLYWLGSDEFTQEERKEYLAQFLPRAIRSLGSIPYHFRTSLINEISISWYKNASEVLPEYASRVDFLKKMVICRQPITYIHSIMTSRIAVLIAEELLWKRPELFLEAFEKDSVEELLTDRESVLEFIDQCGIIHDIGKTQMVDIINQQTRRLSDREFALIRQHSERGATMLADDEGFLPYHDVILGHHRTYDGKGGYPMSFDNIGSPKRFLIDLVTIADCTDAATDILGRNYATGKDFQTLLEELKAQAGTRYNPDIVDAIVGSKRLQENLANLTSSGRYSIYYEAYRFIESL